MEEFDIHNEKSLFNGGEKVWIIRVLVEWWMIYGFAVNNFGDVLFSSKNPQ